MYTKKAITMWQSNRSAKPPWPGMLSAKSLIFRPRLSPDAKNPPNGATTAANSAMTPAWICAGEILI